METQEKINLLSYLCKVGEEFSSIRDTDQLLAKIIQTSREICNADKASILLLDKERQDLYFKETAGELGEKIKKIRVPLSENSIAGWVALNKIPASIPDVLHDKRHYKKVDQIMRYETKSLLAVPILWQDTVYGVIEVLNKKSGELFNKMDEEFLSILAAKAAVALNNVSLVEQLQNFFIYNLEIVIDISDNMEPQMQGHLTRVARYSIAIAKELGFKSKDVEDIWYAAYFHDIGKLKVKHENEMRFHPILGANLLKQIKLLNKIIPIVKYHHERYDGSGYPEGLKGEEIPIGSRILSLLEDYEEKWLKLKDVLPQEKIKEEFLNESKQIHDPKILKIFAKLKIYRNINLNKGKIFDYIE